MRRLDDSTMMLGTGKYFQRAKPCKNDTGKNTTEHNNKTKQQQQTKKTKPEQVTERTHTKKNHFEKEIGKNDNYT